MKKDMDSEEEKRKQWENGWDYIEWERFKEHFKWCEYCNDYFDSEEDYQCMCYTRT